MHFKGDHKGNLVRNRLSFQANLMLDVKMGVRMISLRSNAKRMC